MNTEPDEPPAAEAVADVPDSDTRTPDEVDDGDAGLFEDIADDDWVAVEDLSDEALAHHRVVAVLVAHDGMPWIDRALDAVQAQTRGPERLYVVDTGSTDGTAEFLADRIGPGVETLPRETGFGVAVAHVLDAHRGAPALPAATAAEASAVDWVWLLHDDCAPQPDALRHLLAAVTASPSIAMAGPKVVGWADPRHLLEVGVTIARSGARDTGLERQEQDQGQHDVQRAVLAVSTAGMLVRRDVWDELGGLDPKLTLFRDDIDLGWRVNAAGHRVVVVPAAVVRHAEAASHRRRRISVGPDQPHRLDRYHAMQVLLANMPAWLLPWVVLRLTIGTLARALGFLVGKDPGFAFAEVRALGSTLAHPGTVRAARRARAGHRKVAYGDLRGLLAAPGTQLLHGIEILGSAFGDEGRRPSRVSAPPVEPTGGTGDDDGDLFSGGEGLLSRALHRPGVILVLVALLITLVAERSLLGSGRLLGGVLLPATEGASDLWSSYTAPWHAVGLGSSTPAGGYVPVMAVVSFVLLGKVTLLVDVFLLLAVPLAAGSAYLALRGLLPSLLLRVWAAATYAILPAATGAVASGRLGTALLLVLLPLLARPALRLAGVIDPPPTWRTAWGTGLLLALIAAFVPGAWVLALVLAVAAVATTARGRAAGARLAAALAVAPIVLLPWSWQLVRHPAYLLVEAGVPSRAVADSSPAPFAALLLAPGGPGTPAVWIGLGIVLAAIAALVRGVRVRATTVACVAGLVALLFSVFAARAHVATPQLASAVPAWSGAFLVVAGAALVVAAALAAEGLRGVLADRSFGWHQPVAVVVVALCAVGPAVAAIGWVTRGADDPVRRAEPSLLPAFVAADAQSPARPRTLALRADGPGVVSFSVLRDDGVRLGDAEITQATSKAPLLTTTVSDLASGRGAVAGSALIPYGVRYIVVDENGEQDATVAQTALARTLDGAPGLRRLSSGEGDAVWRVVGTTGRARLVAASGSVAVLPSQDVGIDTAVPAGWKGGTLQLAEVADKGWKATLNGHALTATKIGGWSQGFVVPASTATTGTGRLVVTYDAPGRHRWLLVEGVAFVVIVVLALPSRRRDGEGEDA